MKQQERVLQALMKAGEAGMWTYDFHKLSPPILRPAARIEELRKLGHDIRDRGNRVSRYVLVREESIENKDMEEPMTLDELILKRDALRKEWKQFPSKRTVIEMRGKLLTRAIEKWQERTGELSMTDVKEAFL